MPKVFISYSHDSPGHSARVLEFANSLRAHGVDAELDQYHVRPGHGWPHWCTEQLREENAAFVLLVCTETYRQRVDNKVAADEGRGVYWEGAIIYDYLYDAKGNRCKNPFRYRASLYDCQDCSPKAKCCPCLSTHSECNSVVSQPGSRRAMLGPGRPR